MGGSIHNPPVRQLASNRYRLDAILHEDQAGVTVRAYDTVSREAVIIRYLSRTLWMTHPRVYEAARARLERQWEAVAKLAGVPNILPVLNLVIEPDGGRFLILPQAAGTTLADRLAAGPLPLDAARRVFLDIARALAAAHTRGLVHCSVSLTTIFLLPDGHALLGNWGEMQSDESAIRPQISPIPETEPGYRSPEQEQRSAYLRPASDQYSLGLCLFEMLMGKRYTALRSDERDALIAMQPPAIGALLWRMLATNPDDRLPDMQAVIRQIEPISAPPAGYEAPHVAPPRRQLSRRTVLASLGATLLTGSAAAFIVAEGRTGQRSNAPSPLPAPTVTAPTIPTALNQATATAVPTATVAQPTAVATATVLSSLFVPAATIAPATATATPSRASLSAPSPAPSAAPAGITPAAPTPTPAARIPDLATKVAALRTRYLPTPNSVTLMIVGGETVNLDEDRPDAAASTIKLPIYLTLAHRIATRAGAVTWETPITIRAADVVEGTGVLQHRVGSTFPVREIARLMITESDNVGANIILARIAGFEDTQIPHVRSGAQLVTDYITQIGIAGFVMKRGLQEPGGEALGVLNTVTTAALAALVATIMNEQQPVEGAADLRQYLGDRGTHNPWQPNIAIPCALQVTRMAGGYPIDAALPGVRLDAIHVSGVTVPYILAVSVQTRTGAIDRQVEPQIAQFEGSVNEIVTGTYAQCVDGVTVR